MALWRGAVMRASARPSPVRRDAAGTDARRSTTSRRLSASREGTVSASRAGERALVHHVDERETDRPVRAQPFRVRQYGQGSLRPSRWLCRAASGLLGRLGRVGVSAGIVRFRRTSELQSVGSSTLPKAAIPAHGKSRKYFCHVRACRGEGDVNGDGDRGRLGS